MSQLPEGKYVAVVADHGIVETKAGDERYEILFRIKEGEHEGRVAKWSGGFSDRALDFTIETLRTCGWVGDNLSNVNLPNTVEIVVAHKLHEGKNYVQVKYVNPLTAVRKVASDRMASVAKRLQGPVAAVQAKLAANGGRLERTPKPASASASNEFASEQHDDEIPF